MHWIDPSHLPETRGIVTRFLMNPHGELDGLLLDDALQVHFPPHLSERVARHIGIGDRIGVRGVRPRGIDLIAAVALIPTRDEAIVDDGPPRSEPATRRAGKPMDVQGAVVRQLYGPRGDVRGALLEDGTSLRMAPHAALALHDYLAPGAHVQAWGQGTTSPFGTVVDVEHIAHLVDAV
ncbi:hypothetical protein OVY01_16290 [Robbsia sp. Bb-Pol-6]|uniref:Uncharacterized protein n=1 Tax=Robbsia betulipollinis TaxID=2981849 RepID=A0ABT3ZQC0_9BURK|nr:hypothetical protein [Robbsia betulipollinis]MCY0388735.1 hypothetical protein [Robbsia betulipollinis]